MTVLASAISIFRKLKSAYWRITAPPLVALQGVKLGKKVRFYGLPILSMHAGSSITIEARASLCSVSSHTALGVAHPVILRTLTSEAEIVIGTNAGLSGTTICSASSVRIGSDVLLGADVVITDTDFHPLAPEGRRHEKDFKRIGAAPVVIEDNVFIGTGCVVLKGVRIGRGSVIGATSIVSNDIPAYVIAAGNPARVIRELAR